VSVEQFESLIPDHKLLTINHTNSSLYVEVHSKDKYLPKHFFTFNVRLNGRKVKSVKKLAPHVAVKVFNGSRSDNWNFSHSIYAELKNGFNGSFYVFNNSGSHSKNPVNGTLVAIQFTFHHSDKFDLQVHYSTFKVHDKFKTHTLALNRKIREFEHTFHKNMIFKHFLFPKEKQCALAATSNVLGGLQFSYGDLHCKQDDQINCRTRLPMLSHTPSRLGFPRPFLWDEGFHNMISCRINPEICF
jgi:hypothetical protein